MGDPAAGTRIAPSLLLVWLRDGGLHYRGRLWRTAMRGRGAVVGRYARRWTSTILFAPYAHEPPLARREGTPEARHRTSTPAVVATGQPSPTGEPRMRLTDRGRGTRGRRVMRPYGGIPTSSSITARGASASVLSTVYVGERRVPRSTPIAPVTMALPAAVVRCSGARPSRP